MRAIVALLMVWAAPVAAAGPPLSAWGQLPTVSDIVLSPDGSRWAAVVGDDVDAQIQVRTLADGALLSVTQAGRAKLRGLMWVGNDHLVATTSTTADVLGLSGGKREWLLLLGVDLRASKAWRPLLSNLPDAMNVLSGEPVGLIIEGKPVVVAPGLQLQGQRLASTLYTIDLASGRAKATDKGNIDTIDWMVGRDGRAVARADYVQGRGEWQLLLRQGDFLKQAYREVAPLDRPSMRSFGRDDATIMVASNRSGERENYEVAVADGRWSEPKPEYDGLGIITDPATRTVVGTVGYGLDTVSYRFTLPEDDALWRGVARAFPGELVTLESWSDDRSKIIVGVQGPKNGNALYAVDRVGKTANFLADRYEGISAEQLNPVRSLTYKAADGMDIPAYLTLPKGRGETGLPLVVLSHGGPASRDYPGFDWWAQALASRGYAVLQPQFRGSDGFGAAHREAGFGQWGRKMQTDLSDGVRHLAKAGTIDAARVCIVGASYGGYAAMAGVSVEQGVYRCASAVAGVSDLRQMLVEEAADHGGTGNSTLRYWQRFMGAANLGDRTIDAWSPARLADKVTVPLQLIHGRDDTVVRLAQSTAMARAMTAAGKPVDFVTLDGEDHRLSRPATRIRMLEAQVAFLEKHNPPTP